MSCSGILVSYMEDLKVLYHKGKAGKIYSWRVWTEAADVVTEYGQIDGQKMIARRTVEVKNVGRSNETSLEKQAKLEAQSDHRVKLDRKYVDSIEKVHERKIDVMKAPTDGFEKTKKYVKYPADVQNKLDGNRSLAYWKDGRVVLMSRGRKFWDLPHITKQLEKIMPTDAMFDGELYKHGVSRQTIASWIKKYYKGTTEQIEFHVYDIPICDGEEKPWSDRRKDLDRLVQNDPEAEKEKIIRGMPGSENIIHVPTFEVQNEEQVMMCHAAFVEAGYEGAMIRNFKGTYDWGHRSKNLLKVKKFADDEFLLVGYKNGTGKNETTVTWICETKDGKQFSCEQNATYEERQQMLLDAESYMGKYLTVKYQGFSDDGIPQFVRGIAIRLEEDLDI
jgi:hypothetical protein